MARYKPYIGVTGFMAPEEVQTVAAVMPRFSDSLFMVGILMSSKTLHGLPNKYPGRYPKRNEVSKLFNSSPSVINIIHYSTDDRASLLLQLNAMVGMYCTHSGLRASLEGFQLNIPWPDPATLAEYRSFEKDRRLTFILQIGSGALECVYNNPTLLATRTKEYANLVDYILIDPSGGIGKEMDVSFATNCVQAIYDAGIEINVGIAGGLCTETLDRIQPILEKFPDLSIDAEGRLRDKDDHLSINDARAYVEKAIEVCKVMPL